MKILVLTSTENSYFVEYMCAYLTKRKHEVIKIILSSLFDVKDTFGISFRLSSDDFCFTYNDQNYRISDFDIVWKRRFGGNFANTTLNYKNYQKFPSAVMSYLQREVVVLTDSIIMHCESEDVKFVNNFNPLIHNKIHQLKMAKFFDMNVPEFCFTNQSDNLLTNGIDSLHSVITKPSSNFGYIPDGNKILSHKTSRLKSTDLKDLDDFIFPTFFQKEVKTVFELKCVYIGGDLFAVKQNVDNVELYSDIKLAYKSNEVELENYIVNEEVSSKVKKLCDFYNIDLCTMDFLVDADGEYHFLEINPDGIIAYYSNFITPNLYNVFYKFLLKK